MLDLNNENSISESKMSDKELFSYYKTQLVLMQAKLAVKEALLDREKEKNVELRKAVKYYKDMSTVDSLTGLRNRRAIENVNEYIAESYAPFARI